MPKVIALILMLLLSACAGSTGAPVVHPSATATAQNELRAGRVAYLSAQILVGGYQALPVCGSPGAGAVCYDLNAGQVANRVLAGLKLALDGLDAGLAALSGGDKTVDVVALTTAVVKAAVAAAQIATMFQKG